MVPGPAGRPAIAPSAGFGLKAAWAVGAIEGPGTASTPESETRLPLADLTTAVGAESAQPPTVPTSETWTQLPAGRVAAQPREEAGVSPSRAIPLIDGGTMLWWFSTTGHAEYWTLSTQSVPGP